MAALSDDDRDDLTAYLDGELDEPAAQALEAKLNRDPAARAEADAMRQAWAMLDYLPKPEPSGSFTHRTLERLSLEPRSGAVATKPMTSWRKNLAWAAAVLLLLPAGFGMGYWLGPRPPEPIVDPDEAMIRHLRIAEKWRDYEPIGAREFLNELDRSGLFGEESGS